MNTISFVSALMFLALLLYLAAYPLARRGYFRLHITAVLTGFMLDMYGTYEMTVLRAEGFSLSVSSELLLFHTAFSVAAIGIFLVMLTLGFLVYTGRVTKIVHSKIARYAFLPIWTVALVSDMVILV